MVRRGGRRFRATFRTYLIVLVLASALPLIAFAVAVLLLFAHEQRADFEEDAREAADLLSVGVERELGYMLGVLEGLAASQDFRSGDLARMEGSMRHLHRTGRWSALALVGAGDTLVIDLRETPTESLPAHLGASRLVFATGAPAVSDLFFGPALREGLVSVGVPVRIGGDVTYALTASVPPRRLAGLLDDVRPHEHLPSRRLGVLVDRQGVVLAHTPDTLEPGTYVGQRAPAFDRIRDHASPFLHTVSPEGTRAYFAFTRVPLSDWTAMVAIPEDAVDVPLRRSLRLIALGGGAVVVLVLALALFLALRLARSTAELSARARALGSAALPSHRASSVAEVDDLHGTLDEVSRVLAERTRERERLAAEQAARAAAERAREVAESASRSKDAFLAVLSHELRTPLTATLGWVKLVQSGKLEPEGVQRGLEVIARNTVAQTRLIDDLLEVSRIVSGKMTIEHERVDLARVVEEAIEAVRPSSEAKRLVLTSSLAGGATVEGDGRRLEQVVTNLLTNAVKFTPEGGAVDVRLECRTATAAVTVADTGCGITPDFLPHVFEPFRQAQSGPGGMQRGLGLGLTIVRHLVELHGGRIRVASEGDGSGATFTMELPLVEADRAVAPRGPATDDEAPGARLEGLRVLVVEDHADTRQLLATILVAQGALVQTAGSAPAAREQLERFQPHAVLCDIGLPGESGHDLLRWMRALPAEQGGDTPAVAVTAYARPEDREEALQAGFQAYMAKPFSPDAVVDVVTGLLALTPHA